MPRLEPPLGMRILPLLQIIDNVSSSDTVSEARTTRTKMAIRTFPIIPNRCRKSTDHNLGLVKNGSPQNYQQGCQIPYREYLRTSKNIIPVTLVEDSEDGFD